MLIVIEISGCRKCPRKSSWWSSSVREGTKCLVDGKVALLGSYPTDLRKCPIEISQLQLLRMAKGE
jgi:hypothetical protein